MNNFNYFKDQEADKIAQELLHDIVPYDTLTKYYKYGQSSIIAWLLDWVESAKSSTEDKTLVEFFKEFEDCLNNTCMQDETLGDMTKRLLKDYEK